MALYQSLTNSLYAGASSGSSSTSGTSLTLSDTTASTNNTTGALIVSGGAKGADALAERYARENIIPMDVNPPNFKFGRSAFFIRNQEIVDTSDHIIAFPTGDSRGTYNTISKARKAGKPITVIEITL